MSPSPARRRAAAPPAAPAAPAVTSREAILGVLARIVEPLQRSIPGTAEVVLHDLSKLPDSIVAVAGSVTGRAIGSPATDKLLAEAASGQLRTDVGYETRMPGGRELRSTTIVVPDADGRPLAALCINCDVTMWRAVHEIAAGMLPSAPIAVRPDEDTAGEESGEAFVHDIDELAGRLLRQALAAVDAPVPLMQKRHKLAVVEDLKGRGFFMLKESVETAAAALGVTRFTIYNYLNEIDQARGPAPAGSEPSAD